MTIPLPSLYSSYRIDEIDDFVLSSLVHQTLGQCLFQIVIQYQRDSRITGHVPPVTIWTLRMDGGTAPNLVLMSPAGWTVCVGTALRVLCMPVTAGQGAIHAPEQEKHWCGKTHAYVSINNFQITYSEISLQVNKMCLPAPSCV